MLIRDCGLLYLVVLQHRGDVSASDNREEAAGDQGPAVEDKPAAADRADAPPRPQRQFGAIYSELYRRRLERLQMTEPGRIDMTTAMLRPRQAERAEPIAGGRRGKKKLPWEDDKVGAWVDLHESECERLVHAPTQQDLAPALRRFTIRRACRQWRMRFRDMQLHLFHDVC